MVKIRIVVIGKDKDRWVTEAVIHFEKLLSRWAAVEWIVIPRPKGSLALSPALIRKQESELLMKQFGSGINIALDDSGKQFDTPAFAALMEKLQVQSTGPITFIIGGPYGFNDNLRSKADRSISLSLLTFSHQLVRLVLLEQLYRSLSILHGTDYHK